MPIEVRQMIVRSSVAQAETGPDDARRDRRREEELKREVLAECRREILRIRDDARER